MTDQRSTDDVDCVELFPCRELLPTDDVRERAAELVAAEPWGREQWERLAEGLTFDGMESWLPWLTDGEHVLLDLLGPDAQVLLVEPRRMRDRAADLLAEEADLAATLAQTWGAADGPGVPRLHLPFDRLLAHTTAPAWTVTTVARRARRGHRRRRGWDPVVGDAAAWSASWPAGRRRLPVVVGADGKGSAARWSLGSSAKERALPCVEPDGSRAGDRVGGPGRRDASSSQPLERGFILPSSSSPCSSESRRHRPPPRPPRARPRRTRRPGLLRRPEARRLRRPPPARRGPYGGMVKRAIGGAERDYLLLEYRGGDKLYVPSDQIDAVRHYTGGETPTLHRLGGSDWQHQGEGAGRRCARSPRSWSCSTSAGDDARPRLSARHAVAARAGGGVSVPGDARPAEGHRRREGRHGGRPRPMDRLVCGDVGFGKTEVAIRAAFKAVQDGKQVAVLVPTTVLAQQHLQHLPGPLRRLPGAGRDAVALPHAGPGAEGRSTAWPTAASTSSSAHIACSRRTFSFKNLGLS